MQRGAVIRGYMCIRPGGRPPPWILREIQMDGTDFRLISGLAELSRKVRNTANILLSATFWGWHMDYGNYLRQNRQ